MASDVTLLPQPDSPTMPRVSPGATSNEIPLTAWTVPRLVQNWKRNSIEVNAALVGPPWLLTMSGGSSPFGPSKSLFFGR